MFTKIHFLLIFAISFQIFYLSLATNKDQKSARIKRPPRTYGVEYPDVRRVNVTLRPIEKPKLESRIESQNNKRKNIEEDLIPMSRVGLSGVVFPEESVTFHRKSNTTQKTKKRNKTKVKRVTRQISDFEKSECDKCLDVKYMKHYYEKGCKPQRVEAESYCKKPCPKYFECPKVETKPSTQGCEYKGVIYNISDEIPNPNECLHCRCSGLTEPKINCAVSECFSDWKPLNYSCYRSYEDGLCCSRHKCLTDEQLKQVKTCLYDGKKYKLGEKIYPKEDNCISCICNEKWNETDPFNSPSCKKIDCDFELENKWNNKEGCAPIYHENHCCPIDYHCPVPKEWKCSFGGQMFDIGEKLVTKSDCLECICRVPPDFTCIRRKCDRKPVDSDCTPIYETNKCCPTYNCTNDGKEVANRTNKMLLKVETPILKVEKSENPCPPIIPEGLSCAGTNCTTIIDPNGCQACSCEVSCPQLDCIYPCFLFVITPGQCPQCKCDSN